MFLVLVVLGISAPSMLGCSFGGHAHNDEVDGVDFRVKRELSTDDECTQENDFSKIFLNA